MNTRHTALRWLIQPRLDASPKVRERAGRVMSAAEQFHLSEVSPSYWRVTFDNGPVNLLDPDTIDQLGALIGCIEPGHDSFGHNEGLTDADRILVGDREHGPVGR